MGKASLTDLLVKALPSPAAGQTEVWDVKMPGFGIRISPSGTKAFVLVYRFQGRSRRLTLGRYPSMSLAEARAQAHQALVDLAGGNDPIAVKQAPAASGTIPAAIDMFIAMHCEQNNKASTTKETTRILRANFSSTWRARNLADISKRDVVAVLDTIVQRGSLGSANHALSAIRKFFNWCVERGMLEVSPCFGVKNPAKNGKRDRLLSDAELLAVWRAAAVDGFPLAPIVQLLILTGQRRGEVTGLRWVDLDLDADLWSLPAEFTKAGRAHAVPISPLAKRIVLAMPRVHDTLLFPARGVSEKSYDGFNKAKSRLDLACGFSDWTLHDLRRTAATGMARLGIAPHVIERVLNHASGSFAGVAGIYNRFGYLAEMRQALLLWDQHVAALIGTKQPVLVDAVLT